MSYMSTSKKDTLRLLCVYLMWLIYHKRYPEGELDTYRMRTFRKEANHLKRVSVKKHINIGTNWRDTIAKAQAFVLPRETP
jgi:hypothetical protein